MRAAFDRSGPETLLLCVPTADAAVDVLKRETVDAIFLNQLQSGMETFEFMRALNALNRDIPVIVVVPHTDEQTVLRALRDGAHDCIAAGRDSSGAYPAAALRAITRSKNARENSERSNSIIRSQKQWMSIIDAITDFIFVLDSGQTLVKVNHSFATAIGMHPREVVGKRIDEVFDMALPIQTFLNDVLKDGIPRIYEKKINEEIYQISIFPLQENSRPLTIHVMKNITEVRRLKDQLYHSDKLASIGLLVSGVAHEINNPLTGTIAYTELLAMKTTDAGVKAELKKILDSAERCKKIVDNLMTFSRQRTPSKSLETVNDIIDRAIDLRSYWLKANNIAIVKEYDPVSTVFVDAQQIQQVVLNLLLNAEQAIVGSGQTKGRIRFATKYDRSAGKMLITVIDNGPGIPPKVASKVFDPFFTTKPVGVGTGLGLSISHGIIIEHGGTIGFENIEGNGTAFRIELPTGAGRPRENPVTTKESERIG